MNTRKHILFHRPTPWDSPIQCSTKNLANVFSKSNYDVTYLRTLHIIHRFLEQRNSPIQRKEGRFDNRIWVANSFSLIPYLDNNKGLARITGKFRYFSCFPNIKKLVKRSGYGSPDIIWTTVPGSSVLKEIFPESKLFFHVIDSYIAYRGEGVTVLESRDYQIADHIFVIGQALKSHLVDKFGVCPGKITNLGQGVAIDEYQGEFSAPEDIQSLPSPRAVWVGLIKKLDVPLLRTVVDEMKQVGGSTILIGPGFESIANEFKNENGLVCLGPKPSEVVPDYLRSCDLGLMLYDRNKPEIYEGQHPLKLYEYAAAGLPTISTYHKEFEYINPPVLEANSEEEVVEAIEMIQMSPLKYRAKMLEFASSHSWEICKSTAENIFAELGV